MGIEIWGMKQHVEAFASGCHRALKRPLSTLRCLAVRRRPNGTDTSTKIGLLFLASRGGLRSPMRLQAWHKRPGKEARDTCDHCEPIDDLSTPLLGLFQPSPKKGEILAFSMTAPWMPRVRVVLLLCQSGSFCAAGTAPAPYSTRRRRQTTPAGHHRHGDLPPPPTGAFFLAGRHISIYLDACVDDFRTRKALNQMDWFRPLLTLMPPPPSPPFPPYLDSGC